MVRATLIVMLLAAAGCPRGASEVPERDRIRVLIPVNYKQQIEALLASGVREFSFTKDDIDWVNLPYYAGRDAVFAPSLAARFHGSDPDADVFFIDLYRIGAFRPSWLTPFDSGAFAKVNDNFRPAFVRSAKLDGDAVYAIPWSAKGNFLFYRSDLVRGDPPQTFDALFEACHNIPVNRLPRGMRTCLLMNWPGIENDLYPALWSIAGGRKIDFTDKRIVAFLISLADRLGVEIHGGFAELPAAREVDRASHRIHEKFARGEAVFMINWNNRFQFMQKYAAEKGLTLPPLGMAPIPAATTGAATFSNIGTWGWIVPRAREGASQVAKARHDKAMRFVEEVSSPEAVDFFVKSDGLLPARRDVALPEDLARVLSPAIADTLKGKGGGNPFNFEDRGSDTLAHLTVRDVVREVLLCRSASFDPRSEGLGRCAQYVEECGIHQGLETDCFAAAVKRLLSEAQRDIEAIRR